MISLPNLPSHLLVIGRGTLPARMHCGAWDYTDAASATFHSMETPSSQPFAPTAARRRRDRRWNLAYHTGRRQSIIELVHISSPLIDNEKVLTKPPGLETAQKVPQRRQGRTTSYSQKIDSRTEGAVVDFRADLDMLPRPIIQNTYPLAIKDKHVFVIIYDAIVQACPATMDQIVTQVLRDFDKVEQISCQKERTEMSHGIRGLVKDIVEAGGLTIIDNMGVPTFVIHEFTKMASALPPTGAYDAD